MEDDYSHPNDYITTTKSDPLLLKMGSMYVIGCVVADVNTLTAQFTQYHEIIDSAPDEKEVFKYLLENGSPPKFINGGVSPEYMTRSYKNA